MLRIVIATALWVAISLPSVAQQAPLKFAFFSSDQDVTWVRVLKPFVDAVNSDPSGAVKIDPFPNGALGRNLAQQPQMVLDGITDIAFIVPSLSSGRFPDDTIFEVPGLINDLGEGTRLSSALFAANSFRGYSDYVVLASFLNPPANIYSRRPVKAIGDLKGMKVRIVGPVIGQTLKELGAVPVLMPPNEVVEALGRGTVDAVTTWPIGLFDFGVERVTSHDYFIKFGSISFVVVMNRAKFEALPKAAQDVLRKHAGQAVQELYIKQIQARTDELYNILKTNPKNTITEPSAADMEIAKPVFAKVADEWGAKDPHNAQLLTKARELLVNIRANKPTQ